ncbi:MAG: FGGY-family carbohydrate kinase [Alphaproteobacteria bacterium]|nr:FGGY-family carbohydrate kinase [Alphaproteobacteria bacterium]
MTDSKALYLGLDLGTSGVRAVCIDGQGQTVAEADGGFVDDDDARDPGGWQAAIFGLLDDLARQIKLDRVVGLSVDGTSGTVLLCDDAGQALSPSKFYDEAPSIEATNQLMDIMLEDGATVPPSLGRVLDLWWQDKPAEFNIVHQADWIAGMFCGRFDFSDQNNALKTGFDPSTNRWSFDTRFLPFSDAAMPRILPPATSAGRLSKLASQVFGLSPDCQVYAGTTDGTAGVIAASGLDLLEPGTAVTTLGTTLVIKSVSPMRVDVSNFGIYSHRLFDNWIAGGASNTGGGALLRHFTVEEMVELSTQIDPDVETGLDFYPLVSKGERFPVNDPELADRTSPRPDDPALFLAGLLESIARIEKRGFDLMQAYGVPYPTLVKTVGGGSRNDVWLKIRERVLGAKVIAAEMTEPAYGAALIALRGVRAQ